jgi:hypothetical protein
MTRMTRSDGARGVDFCRSCGHEALVSVLDLGEQPLANTLLTTPDEPETAYPLHLRICPRCGLGQLGEFASPESIFSLYPYRSSMSTSWLAHVATFADEMTGRMRLGEGDLVVEVASNDGHLLRQFQRHGVRVCGVEPAANIATVAESEGVPTICAFFGLETAERVLGEVGQPRLVVANNVLAHVPDINDFMAGLARLCGPDSVVTVENPSFTGLLRDGLFDTIYHEHFSYLSVLAVKGLAERHGLALVDVEMLPTHGGSYRYVLAQPDRTATTGAIKRALDAEVANGLLDAGRWSAFEAQSRATIDELRTWFDAGDPSRVVVGCGAPAKGNTLLNAASATPDDVVFVTDRSPEKQGRFLPGSRIPVRSPADLASSAATDVLVLPWNISRELSQEIARQSHAQQWIAVPRPTRIGMP